MASSSAAAAATVFRLRPMLHNTAPPGESRRSRCAVPVARHKQRRTPTVLRSLSLMCGRVPIRPIQANLAADPSIAEADRLSDVLYEETLRVERTAVVEGKVRVEVEWEEKEDGGGLKGQLLVGCDLDGKWTLHWGVTYFDQIGSEWDQPSEQMRPPGSVAIKDYAIETPLEKSSSCSEGPSLHQLKIDLDSSMSIAAIHFVLKDEETGAWFQHRGRDFKIPLLDETVCGRRNFTMWPSSTNQISNLLLKPEGSQLDANSQDNRTEDKDIKHDPRRTKGFYEEYQILKEQKTENCITVTVKKCDETNKNKLFIDTDIPGEVVVHWGVCRDDKKTWEVPTVSLPPESIVFRGKAIQTLLQQKTNSVGSSGIFLLDEDISGVLFVLKLNEYTWVNNMGDNFFIPLINEGMYSQMRSKLKNTKAEQEMNVINNVNVTTENDVIEDSSQTSSQTFKSEIDDGQEVAYTNGIITGIRNLVTGITSEKSKSTKSKEEQENILQEIEKLASEAYSIFRSSVPIFSEESTPDTETVKLPVVHSSGTGSGYEILCQGFNWESHKSGRWYTDILTKAEDLANFGFTTVWLPPPTESVSPEGYMPKDLYNLNSRYGNIEELRAVVKRLHEVGIKVLGDVVLNHRCAHYKNQHGIWNIFGGRLNWDDRAIVNDDPHFQGKGNKSSGDNFHAAPNIDHSQEFVRKDIKEWLCWLRKEIGYDGWRLDFARGFWGGYVREYLDATEPFFAVGEYWDSLSYTYGQMDHNQNAHRQRIVDWINATNGTAGAFDVTTKGILHTALEKCEYWRLSDDKGKPPGVIGWWPSRAVTFIENHDTGSTQGHWRFPAGKEMQGYAYILTHPGTPTVFYDHIYSHLQQEIAYLISLRHRLKIHCRSMLKITTLERDVYAAIIDDRVAMKIGPGRYEPPSYSNSWTVAAEGKDYKVWESS